MATPPGLSAAICGRSRSGRHYGHPSSLLDVSPTDSVRPLPAYHHSQIEWACWPHELLAEGPRVWVSITGHGYHGPGADRVVSAGDVSFVLSLSPIRRIMKDYFIVCDTYYQAIRTAPPSRIQAIDMGRRALHDWR